jgi:hypothetical protein
MKAGKSHRCVEITFELFSGVLKIHRCVQITQMCWNYADVLKSYRCFELIQVC